MQVGKLPVIKADRSQIHQLLQNLVGNALKFHKEGETPVVRVYGGPLNERGDNSNGKYRASSKAQIVVEDNGIGFDEEYLEQIFVPFQRLLGRDTYEGTRLGLAICRRIVERHGGDLIAESVCGLRTKFVVTLPVEQASTSATVFAIYERQLTSDDASSS
ncbi:MAG TPA: ATP-binding protein [Rubrobacteraceae bacterium]|nr:ATP-binding protein [Rubrobacteraceae bacterium]